MPSERVIEINPGNGPGQHERFARGYFTKHFVLLPGEDESQLLALLSSLEREHTPATPTERQLVREMAETQWRLARVGRQEAEYLTQHGSDLQPAELLKWERLTDSARRAYRAAWRDLYEYRRVRNTHLALSPHPEIEDPEPTYDVVLPPKPEAPPESAEPEPIKVPYPFAMELKALKRAEPHFDPTRSRKMSVRLRDFCKDQYNLDAVLKLLPTI